MVYQRYIQNDQECLDHDPFSTFCLTWPNSISKKNGRKSKLLICPKPISNDQVGPTPCSDYK